MAIKNILFVMYDQLRFDYLGCAGHPSLETPNFDRLAARGVRFDRAYVQSPICGSSRMCFYTGRYAQSHGAEWNGYPLRVGERTLGDHLRDAGMACHLIGKTHMRADEEGMARLGVDPDSIIGVRVSECGFDPWLRDDGMVPEGPDGSYDGRISPYNEDLKARGYPGPNPWAHYANSGIDEVGDIATGWLMKNATRPANIAEKDSETPWLTDRALEFLETETSPWCAHLSYIKPHWPYIVPAPYHGMYGPGDCLPVRRHDIEREDPHPVFAAMLNERVSRTFQRDEVREGVLPAYMGLIKQCDDQLGRVLDRLEETGAMAETMIVLTSDHGDYLGDHWLGEKNFFHDASVRVPMIVYDPSPEADATRGTVSDALVESIDLAPTFVEAAGGTVAREWLEGRSLLPLLRGQDAAWRDYVISEYSYAAKGMADTLGVRNEDARMMMVFDGRWKLIHFEGGFPPMLFDLDEDPDEFHDRGRDPTCAAERERLYDMLHAWARRQSQRVTRSAEDLARMRRSTGGKGVIIGAWDETDTSEHALVKYTGRAAGDFRDKG